MICFTHETMRNFLQTLQLYVCISLCVFVDFSSSICVCQSRFRSPLKMLKLCGLRFVLLSEILVENSKKIKLSEFKVKNVNLHKRCNFLQTGIEVKWIWKRKESKYAWSGYKKIFLSMFTKFWVDNTNLHKFAVKNKVMYIFLYFVILFYAQKQKE